MSELDFDLIVIGGGGGGMAAALSAANEGGRVLLVEAAGRCGGATALSEGAFYAAGTSVQRQAGVEGDTPDAMYRYGMALNSYRMLPSVFRRFCEDGASTLDWLMGLGVQYLPVALTVGDCSGVARAHWPVGKGAAIAEALEGHLQAAGVEITTNTRVRKLVIVDGAVAGIDVDGEEIMSKAVVIASGGFGANGDLLAKHYRSSQVPGSWYIGPPTAQGDALTLGADAGAALYGEDRGLLLMSPGLRQTLEVAPGWLLLVNQRGNRFMDESAPYCVQNGVFKGQPEQTAYAIFDHATYLDPPPDPRWAAAIASGDLSTDFKPDILAEGLASGRIVTGATLEQLAPALGIAGSTLVESVARYNADVSGGVDPEFFKPAELLRPIGDSPYYAAKLTMQIICFTSFGLKIDREARVLDESGRAISGLYAAGEASAGPQGEVYLGSGTSVANALIFGRIAGLNAVRYARSNSMAR